MLLYIPMTRVIILALFLLVSNLSAAGAAKLQYAPTAGKLLVTEAALGEEITITESDLSELVADIRDDASNIDGTIFLRVFLKESDQKRIESIIKTDTVGDSGIPIIVIEKTPDTNATSTRIKYAQVSKQTPNLGSLIYHEADAVQFLDTIDKFTFGVRNFSEVYTRRKVMFQLEIDNVWNHSGTLKFTVKLSNEPSSNSTDSGNGGDNTGGGGTTSGGTETTTEAGIQSFSIRVNTTLSLLNKNYICVPTSSINTENICDVVELQTLSTNLSTRISQIKTNKSFLESLSFTILQKRQNKEISKLQKRSLQNQIKKAITVNTAAVKALKFMKAKIDKVRLKSGTFETTKRQAALQSLRAAAQNKVNRVDSLVNAQLANDLLNIGLISQTTLESL